MQRSRPARPPPPNVENSSQTMEQKLRFVKECYESSMCYVNNGLTADEENNANMAMQHYMNALQCLEKGLGTDLPHNESYSRGHAMQSRMMEVLEHVQTRLYDLQSSQTSSNNNENAVQLLNIPGGVQMFCITSDSDVSSAPPSYPSSLQIMLFDDEKPKSSNRPPGFVQVGDWIYPLVPGQSPVLRCTNGAYMFPNLTVDHSSPHPNTVGLVISSELDPSYREMFENILMNFAAFQVQGQRLEGEPIIDLSSSVPYIPEEEKEGEKEKDGEATVSDKIAHGIEKGAEWLSWGLSKGAEMTTSLITKGANKLQANLQPNTTATKVNPSLEKGLYYTHQASKVTVKVSAALVNGLCTVTKEIGRAISPHVVSCAKTVLPSSATDKDDKGVSTMDGVVNVAGAGLAGFATVWTSLEQAGLAVARSMSGATVETVQHKYGAEAGQATGHAMGAAVNVGRTAFNIDNLGVKAIVKRTAKDTGREVLKDFAKEKDKNGVEDDGVTTKVVEKK
ncbi:spartin isoform X2 [Ciona intestinalis]